MRDARPNQNWSGHYLDFGLVLALLAGLLFANPASAQSQDPLGQRISDIARLMAGDEIDRSIFTENFINAIPPEQIRQFRDKLITDNGPFMEVSETARESPHVASIALRYKRSTAYATVTIETSAPHRIAGLHINRVEANAETLDDVMQMMQSLPGRTAFGIFQLSDGAPQMLNGFNPDERFAIASTFKLYVLAELDRAVRAGERHWSDVVILGPKSHPSGIMQQWPSNSPVTLQTLATLMISQSDNSATDTLIRVIGQDRLAQIVQETGHSRKTDLIPMLSTQQVSALKMEQNNELRRAFLAGNDFDQTQLITENSERLSLATVDLIELTSGPKHLDTIEWFASTSDIARLMQYLREHASAETRAILSINPGIGPGAAHDFDYLGFKGGSNQGVLALNLLVQRKDGKWLSISAFWNDSEAPLNESRFTALVSRAVTLIAE